MLHLENLPMGFCFHPLFRFSVPGFVWPFVKMHGGQREMPRHDNVVLTCQTLYESMYEELCGKREKKFVFIERLRSLLIVSRGGHTSTCCTEG